MAPSLHHPKRAAENGGRANVNVVFHLLELYLLCTILYRQSKAKQQTERIEMTQAEAAVKLQEVNAKLTKVGTETTALLTKIQELQAAAENAGNVGPELQAAIDAVATQAQVVDDQVPDAVPVPPPTEPPVEP